MLSWVSIFCEKGSICLRRVLSGFLMRKKSDFCDPKHHFCRLLAVARVMLMVALWCMFMKKIRNTPTEELTKLRLFLAFKRRLKKILQFRRQCARQFLKPIVVARFSMNIMWKIILLQKPWFRASKNFLFPTKKQKFLMVAIWREKVSKRSRSAWNSKWMWQRPI